MITENLSTLKIHKLTQEQYDRELASGNIDENALYLTPDEANDQSMSELIDIIDEYKEETNTALSGKSDTTHTHDNYEAIGVAATKANEALESAKSYTDQEIADLINAAPETLDTLGELATAMKENQDVVDVLNNAITLKADKAETVNAINSINENIEDIESKDLLEIKEASGKAIAVDDSANTQPAELILKGETIQNGTPTPDNPIELKSVGDSGSFNVGVYGKNLLNVAQAVTVSKGYVFNNLLIDFGAGDYVFSFTASITQSAAMQFIIYDDTGELVLNVYPSTQANVRTEIPFTIKEPGTFYVTFYVNLNSVTITNCQIELGTQATPYEPFAKQTLTMPYTLRSVGDIKDEVDFNRGVLYKRLGVTTITSSDEIRVSAKHDLDISANHNGVFFSIHKTTNDTFAKASVIAISNYFKGAVNYFEDIIGIYSFENGLCLRIPKTLLADISTQEKAIQSFKNWLSDKTVKVVYQLPNTIETPLTESELNAYRQLMMNKPNTTLISDANMKLKYVVGSNTAEYLDRRFEEVADEFDEKLEDKLSFDEEVVNSISDVSKIVPEGSGKYAAVNKVGGMSYKSKNLFDSVEIDRNGTLGKFKFLAGIQYIISLIATSTVSGNYPCIIVRNPSGTQEGQITNYGNSTLITTQKSVLTVKFDTNTEWNILAQADSATGSNTTAGTFKAQIEEGTEATIYEPYYSGLRNAYVTGIKSVGKNLADYSKFKQQNYATDTSITINDNVVTFYANQNGFYLDDLVMRKGVTYLITGHITNIVNFRIFRKGDWLNTVANVVYNPTTGGIGCMYTPTYDDEVIRIWVAGQTAVLTDFMISVADVSDSTYSPYKENTFTIPTGARGVGYGMGINESCYNYIDFERKVYVQNCAKVNLSTLNWNIGTTGKDIWTSDLSDKAVFPIDYYEMPTALINKYTMVNRRDLENWIIDTCCLTPNKNFTICSTEDLNTFKESVKDVWLIYKLATPIETDISDFIQDNFIEVAEGGVITAVNEYNYNVPSEISFYTSETPEKVIVADTFVGDFKGTFTGELTTSGTVAASSFKIGEGCNLVYDTTNKCVSFQFL